MCWGGGGGGGERRDTPCKLRRGCSASTQLSSEAKIDKISNFSYLFSDLPGL